MFEYDHEKLWTGRAGATLSNWAHPHLDVTQSSAEGGGRGVRASDLVRAGEILLIESNHGSAVTKNTRTHTDTHMRVRAHR